MKRYFIIVATAMAVLMQGSPVEARDRYENVKSVAILCGIKDRITFSRHGFFNETFDGMVLPGWRICDHIVAWATHALSPRFEIKAVAYDAGDVERCRDSCGYALPSNANVDAYVVIHPMWQQDGNWLLAGLGFGHHPVAIIGARTSLRAYFRVGVYDAKTYKQIDYGTARVPIHDLIGALPASVEFDPGNWVDRIRDVTPTQVDAIKAGMTRLIRIALAMALSGANLMPRPDYSNTAHVVAMVAGREPIQYFADVPDPPPPQPHPAVDPAATGAAGATPKSGSLADQTHEKAPVSDNDSAVPSQ